MPPLKSYSLGIAVVCLLFSSTVFSVQMPNERSIHALESERETPLSAGDGPTPSANRSPASFDTPQTLSVPIESTSFFRDSGEEFSSVFSAPASKYLYVGAATSFALYAFAREQVIEKTQRTVVNNQVFGKESGAINLIGEAVPNIAYSVAQLGHGYFAKNRRSYLRAEMMVKASLYTGLSVVVLKNAFQEERPDGGNHSFPSGHTATAFSFATIIAMEHGWVWGSAAYSAATVAGYARMNDNRHYLHDCIAGAAIGTAFGVGIHHLLSKKYSYRQPYYSFNFMPAKDGGMAAFRWEY